MKRRRNLPQSSLELFLDTICNTFGGILLIAILVAVQIRQTEGNLDNIDLTSPEEVIALQKQLDQLTADIKLATALRETTKHTALAQKNINNNYTHKNYEQLVNEKNNSTIKKNELTSLLNKQKNENQQLTNQITIIVTNIQNAGNEVIDLDQQIQKQQAENLAKKKSNENSQQEINTLKQQISQKESNKNQQTISNTRNEILYLPKLRESKTTQSVHLILRFNRVYDASIRTDFDSPSNEQLGVPKTNRGIIIDTSERAKNEIQKLLQKYSTKNFYATIIVYGDSADQFYIVRNILIELGFEYDLKPSGEDSIWKFTGKGGARDVQ
jgi:chromosome segregation ATPase